MRRPRSRPAASVLALLVALLGPVVVAETAAVAAPGRLGPDPTTEFLEQPTGPFAFDRVRHLDDETDGFGAATTWFPTDAGPGPFGAVALSPGFTEPEAVVAWLGPLLASHGFVAITFDTQTPTDLPAARGLQLLAALDHVSAPASPVAELVDAERLAVMGHSMGGGGVLEASALRPTLAAAIPLTPWHPGKVWPEVETPTLIVGGQTDQIATVEDHARPIYEGLPDTIPKAYTELRDADHFVPNAYDPTVARLTVAWLKRFVDDDERYEPFVCSPDDDPSLLSDVRSTCPFLEVDEPPVCQEPPFVDVPIHHPFCPVITWMGAEGIATGYPDGTFRPGVAMTRQALAAFFHRSSEPRPAVTAREAAFGDVAPEHPFATDIDWFVDTGLTTGFPDGTFRPGALVTRQAVAAFLHRQAGRPSFAVPASATFPDVPASHPFHLEVEWSSAMDVTRGYEDGTFRPSQPVTREAASAFLHRVERSPRS